jgi:hypothetical protein
MVDQIFVHYQVQYNRFQKTCRLENYYFSYCTRIVTCGTNPPFQSLSNIQWRSSVLNRRGILVKIDIAVVNLVIGEGFDVTDRLKLVVVEGTNWKDQLVLGSSLLIKTTKHTWMWSIVLSIHSFIYIPNRLIVPLLHGRILLEALLFREFSKEQYLGSLKTKRTLKQNYEDQWFFKRRTISPHSVIYRPVKSTKKWYISSRTRRDAHHIVEGSRGDAQV